METDSFSFLLVDLILIYLGQVLTVSTPKIKQVGVCLALFAFVSSLFFSFLSQGELLSSTLAALLIAGFTLGIAWILLFLIYTVAIVLLFRCWQILYRRIKHKREKRQRAREEWEWALQKKREQENWARMAPEREREYLEQRQEKEYQIKEQERREEVRLCCQLLYDQHAQQLQEQFPRSRLTEYMQEFLSDKFTAEMVERRGELLQEMIQNSLGGHVGRESSFCNLQEIADYFKTQRTDINSLGYDTITCQTIQASLNAQEEASIRAFLSRKR